MAFALASGRICLAEWSERLTVEHVVNLLIDLRELRQGLRSPPLLLLSLRPPVFTRRADLDVVPTALPAILDGCSALFVVVDPNDPNAALVRRLFTDHHCGPRKPVLEIFDSLDDAFVAAQRTAPHDALEVQRQNLRRSSPP